MDRATKLLLVHEEGDGTSTAPGRHGLVSMTRQTVLVTHLLVGCLAYTDQCGGAEQRGHHQSEAVLFHKISRFHRTQHFVPRHPSTSPISTRKGSECTHPRM
jgi:hypothetical protein